MLLPSVLSESNMEISHLSDPRLRFSPSLKVIAVGACSQAEVEFPPL